VYFSYQCPKAEKFCVNILATGTNVMDRWKLKAPRAIFFQRSLQNTCSGFEIRTRKNNTGFGYGWAKDSGHLAASRNFESIGSVELSVFQERVATCNSYPPLTSFPGRYFRAPSCFFPFHAVLDEGCGIVNFIS
jgi:hypothetical protein